MVEDMDLLAINKKTKIKRIVIAPWLIEKIDSAPCTIYAEVDQK